MYARVCIMWVYACVCHCVSESVCGVLMSCFFLSVSSSSLHLHGGDVVEERADTGGFYRPIRRDGGRGSDRRQKRVSKRRGKERGYMLA